MALTCMVGKTKIISTDYQKEELRNWSYKGILKCDCCDTQMIYKHGDFKIPHFAHKSANCELQYSEPESEEHINGKLTIYNWLKTQNVENLELESWIPETRQRPDIYFERNGQRFVIEFQCTPIATEFNERRKLYKLAGIKDIWILGFNNYGFYEDYVGHIFTYDTKVFEREIFEYDEILLHMFGNKLIPFVKGYSSMVTDVVKYSFETCLIDIFDLELQDIIMGDYFKETISYNTKTRAKIMSDRDKYIKFLSESKKYMFLNIVKSKLLSIGYIENIKNVFVGNQNNIRLQILDNYYNKIIENKTIGYNIEKGNYIIKDKIVTINETHIKTLWNYNRKRGRKISTKVWYMNKTIQSIYDFDVDLLYKN